MASKRRVEAELVLSADDRMSRVVKKAMDDMKRAARDADISKEMRKAATEADKAAQAYAAVNKVMANTDAARKARDAMRQSQEGLTRLTRDLEAAKRAKAAFDGVSVKRGSEEARRYQEASRAVSELSRQHRRAEAEIRKLSAAQERETTALRQSSRAAADFGVNLNKITQAERALRTQVEHTTRALKAQIAAEGGAGSGGGPGGGSMLAGAARFGMGAAGAAGGAYLVGSTLKGGADSALSFERAMIEVAKATDVSGAALAKHSEAIFKLSRETGIAKEQVAKMYADMGKAGVPVEELAFATELAAKASKAWGVSTEQAGERLAQLRASYQITTKELEKYADAINITADAGASNESDILDIMARVGATAKQVGLTKEQFLSLAGSMKEVGIQNEVVGTGLQAMFNTMKLGEKVTKSAEDGFKALGLSSDKVRKDFIKNPYETLLRFLERLQKIDDPMKRAEIFTDIFGKEFQDDAERIVNITKRIRELETTIRSTAAAGKGGVFGQFSDQLGTNASQIDRATAALDELQAKLSTPINEAKGALAERINTMVDRIIRGDTVLGQMVNKLGQYDNSNATPEQKLVGDETGRFVTDALRTIMPGYGKREEELTRLEVERRRASGETGAFNLRGPKASEGVVGSGLNSFGISGPTGPDGLPAKSWKEWATAGAKEAGRQAGQYLDKGVAEGILDGAADVYNQGQKLYRTLKELFSDGIKIPMGFEPGFGGGGGGGAGIRNVAYNPDRDGGLFRKDARRGGDGASTGFRGSGGSLSPSAPRNAFGGSILPGNSSAPNRFSPLPPGRPSSFSTSGTVPSNAFGGTDPLASAVSGGLNPRAPQAPGQYRPQYPLSEADTHQRVLDTIASEARMRDPESVDGVINNMLNRVGSKRWGPSANLYEVSQARGQYEGAWKGRRATAAESEYLRNRIAEIASGGVPDNTGGSNSFRAESYYRGAGRNRKWARTSVIGNNVGGNRYGFVPSVPNGPYAPYDPNAVVARPSLSAPFASKDGPGLQIPDAPVGKGGFGLGGVGALGKAAQEFKAATERLSGMGWKTRHEVEVTAAPGISARTKSMKAHTTGPIQADVGVSMPHTRSRATV